MRRFPLTEQAHGASPGGTLCQSQPSPSSHSNGESCLPVWRWTVQPWRPAEWWTQDYNARLSHSSNFTFIRFRETTGGFITHGRRGIFSVYPAPSPTPRGYEMGLRWFPLRGSAGGREAQGDCVLFCGFTDVLSISISFEGLMATQGSHSGGAAAPQGIWPLPRNGDHKACPMCMSISFPASQPLKNMEQKSNYKQRNIFLLSPVTGQNVRTAGSQSHTPVTDGSPVSLLPCGGAQTQREKVTRWDLHAQRREDPDSVSIPRAVGPCLAVSPSYIQLRTWGKCNVTAIVTNSVNLTYLISVQLSPFG